jgi:hypothetical protein
MNESARVSSIDAIREWKDALCVFRSESIEALGAIEMEIRRAFDWLDEQTRYWQNELRRREEALLVAKNELVRKKMMPIIGKNPDTTEQDKNLKRARIRLEEAEAKVEQARKLTQVLRQAVVEYEGPGRNLGHMLDAQVPNSVALLERKLDALDAYASMRAPATPREEAPPKETEVKE